MDARRERPLENREILFPDRRAANFFRVEEADPPKVVERGYGSHADRPRSQRHARKFECREADREKFWIAHKVGNSKLSLGGGKLFADRRSQRFAAQR